MSENSYWIGKSIGDRYRIDEVLGRGGMSTVFKAFDPNLRRVVAVKMIHPHMSGDEHFVRRFEEEAAAVAQLRHPNIVQVYDFDHEGDTYYMVLEFVPGETLQERLSRLNKNERQMDVEKVVQYAGDICEAIEYAHERGLIHRDLKPANVILSVHDQAILMDFGIAKIIGGDLHTATGAVIGTARYMSPEQIKGLEIDPRTDLYSLGVTLFEMVNGKPPFEADSAMSLMMMHVNDPIPDLRELKPDLPAKLIPVIEKALSKDRDQRYQSAAEMGAALRGVLAEPEAVDSPSPVGEPQPAEEVLEATLIDQPPGATVEDQPKIDPVTPRETPLLAPDEAVAGQRVRDRVPMGSSQDLVSRIRSLSPAMMAGLVLAVIAVISVIVGGVIFVPRLFAGSEDGEPGAQRVSLAEITPTQNPDNQTEETPIVTESGIGAVFESTATLTDEPGMNQTATYEAEAAGLLADMATHTPEPYSSPTYTPRPTQTTTPSITPSPTLPTDLYVSITGISIEGDYYVVDYETYGYQEELPGMHVHFFFDTVPVEQAGSPGSGPWILYGGPRPFTQYRLTDRPAKATEMCARVANPDHSLYHVGSGNCYPLP